MGKVDRRGQQNTLFVTLVGPLKQFKAYCSAGFSPILTGSLCLGVAQMPRTWDLAIFVATTTDGQTDCFTSCVHARGVTRKPDSNENHWPKIADSLSCRSGSEVHVEHELTVVSWWQWGDTGPWGNCICANILAINSLPILKERKSSLSSAISAADCKDCLHTHLLP